MGRGKANLLFMDGFVLGKGERYSLGVGLNSPFQKKLFELGEGAKRGGTKLTFLFMDQFEWGKGGSCFKLPLNSTFRRKVT